MRIKGIGALGFVGKTSCRVRRPRRTPCRRF